VSGRPELDRDVVIVACAISAGVHAALVPGHGAAFAGAASVLAAVAVALTRRTSRLASTAAAISLAGLLAGWALAVTAGLPLLHPEPEPVTGLAVFAKAVEAAGLLSAARLLGPSASPRPKGTLA
jgi:hypothetical protein